VHDIVPVMMKRLWLLPFWFSGAASASGHYLFAWTGDEKGEGNERGPHGWTGSGKPHGVVFSR
jgi:hypothetical protein